MADVTITGTIKLKNTTRTPGFIYAYPMTDFYIGTVPLQSSSPYDGGLPYKIVAVGAGAAGTGDDVGTMLYTVSIILPPTETATVNPDGARWGMFVMDNATTPRLISEVSGLASFRLPITTPTTLSALALYNGGSLAPVVVNVSVSGTLTVAGLATFDDVVINGTLNGQGIIGGSGVADRISYWTDADTLASSPFLRIDSDTVEQRGSGGANILHVSAGYVDDTDYSRAVISATTAVVIFGVERDGDATGIPVRLASYNDGVVQFGDHDDVWWEMSEDMLLPKVADFGFMGHPDFPIARFSASIGLGNGFRFCSGQADVAGLEYGGLVGVIKASGGGGGRGTIQIGDTLEAKPAADIATRGLFWFDQGGAGVADTVEIVRKTAADVYEYADLLGAAAPGYLVYRALLTQTGTSAPTATVLENSIGAVVLGRASTGSYTAILAGAFTANKTMIFIGQAWTTAQEFAVLRTTWADADTITLETFDVSASATTFALADAILTKTEIQIIVFP